MQLLHEDHCNSIREQIQKDAKGNLYLAPTQITGVVTYIVHIYIYTQHPH